jgi:hypothetical protein
MSFFKGLLNSFTGKTQQGDLDRGFASASGRYDAGYDRAKQDLTYGYDTARGHLAGGIDRLNPWVEDGRNSWAMGTYKNSLGAGGAEGGKAAYQSYQDARNPFFDDARNQEAKLLQMQANNRGSGVSSGAYAQAAARAGTNMRYADYNRWQDNVGTLGNTEVSRAYDATSRQSQLDAGMGDLAMKYGSTLGGYGMNNANALAGLDMQHAQNTAGNRNTLMNNVLGVAGTAAKAFASFSDERLKRNIVPIGEMPSGLPVYAYNYVWSDEPQVGVMAHEARALFPDAVITDESGYLMVDYSRIS